MILQVEIATKITDTLIIQYGALGLLVVILLVALYYTINQNAKDRKEQREAHKVTLDTVVATFKETVDKLVVSNKETALDYKTENARQTESIKEVVKENTIATRESINSLKESNINQTNAFERINDMLKLIRDDKK